MKSPAWWKPQNVSLGPPEQPSQRGSGPVDHGCRTEQVTTREVCVSSSTSMSLAATADAFGAHTLSEVDAQLTITDRGLASFAMADVRATATANGEGDLAAFADVSLTSTESDFSCMRRVDTTSMEAGAQRQTVDLTFFALDLKFDFASGAAQTSAIEREAQAPTVSGNLARFDVHTAAEGDDTLVDVQADAFAVAEALSTVTVAANTAAETVQCYLQTNGTRRADLILGGKDIDLIFAGGGQDKVFGGDGHDWIFGNEGSDVLFGDGGNDTIFGGDSRDEIFGGTGSDWLFGGDSADMLQGQAGDDLLNGGDGDDRIWGGDGNDVLSGGRGDDVLMGGAGADLFGLGLERGDGTDTFFGGVGADTYLIRGYFGRDTIVDFSLEEGDRLAIDSLSGEAADVSFMRSASDRDDLVCTVQLDGRSSVLTLDEFFQTNREFAFLPKRGAFSDAQSAMLLDALQDTDDAGAGTNRHSGMLLTLSDMLAALG